MFYVTKLGFYVPKIRIYVLKPGFYLPKIKIYLLICTVFCSLLLVLMSIELIDSLRVSDLFWASGHMK
jgi:DNA-binding XRE family transcriptional regulator